MQRDAEESLNPAQSLGIYGSTLNSTAGINVNLTQTHWHASGKRNDARKLLQAQVALGALHDSKERFDPPKCHRYTRVAILESFDRWAKTQDQSQPVAWLRGAAGAGKSAIAQSLAESWSEDDLLAACFFFSRTALARNNAQCLVPTIAYQISNNIPSTETPMFEAILKDPGIFNKSLKTQLVELILHPLQQAKPLEHVTPKVVIIDGLDECSQSSGNQDFEEQQREILEAVAALLQEHNLPLKFLIASRPERQIRDSFEFTALKKLSTQISLIQSQESDADVELFLRCSFRVIRDRRKHLPSSWPSEDVIHALVRISSGHLIYAATVIRFISSPRGDPQRSLDIMLHISKQSSKSRNPLEELDKLYMHILGMVHKDSLPNVLAILYVMTHGDIPYIPDNSYEVGTTKVREVRSLLQFSLHLLISPNQLEIDLVDLHSLLSIPEEEFGSLYFHHASFSDFLADPHRSAGFCTARNQSLITLRTRLRHIWADILSGPWLEISFKGQPNVDAFVRDLKNAGYSEELMKGIQPLLAFSHESLDDYLRCIHQDQYLALTNISTPSIVTSVMDFWKTQGSQAKLYAYVKRWTDDDSPRLKRRLTIKLTLRFSSSIELLFSQKSKRSTSSQEVQKPRKSESPKSSEVRVETDVVVFHDA